MVRSYEFGHQVSGSLEQAAADLSPLGSLAIISQLPNTPKIWLPKEAFGFNIYDPYQAKAMLEDVFGNNVHYVRSGNEVLESLKDIKRAAIDKHGNHETVYEHTMELREMVMEDAAKRHDIDSGEADGMVLGHDGPEGAGGDTVNTNPEEVATQDLREEAAMVWYRHCLPANDPLLQSMEIYRNPLTPAQKRAKLLVRGDDKVQAYTYQLKPNVQATLHRERQEEFPPLVKAAFEKIYDHSAYARMFNTLVLLGENWHPWGCKPFDGVAKDIVASTADEVQMERLKAAGGTELFLARYLRPEIVPSLEDKVLEDLGVTLLHKYRASRSGPTPPAPPFAQAVQLAA